MEQWELPAYVKVSSGILLVDLVDGIRSFIGANKLTQVATTFKDTALARQLT